MEAETAPAIFVEQFDKMFSPGLVPLGIAFVSGPKFTISITATETMMRRPLVPDDLSLF
jgi:hypothetical protein